MHDGTAGAMISIDNCYYISQAKPGQATCDVHFTWLAESNRVFVYNK